MQAPFHGRDDNELYESILSQDIRVPGKVSKEATSFLKGVWSALGPRDSHLLRQLLTREIKKRLGCGSSGRKDIENHAFFKTLSWDKLAKMEVAPPFVPTVKAREANNFDEEITSARAVLTPVDEKIGAALNQKDFANFTFVSKKQ